MPTQTQKTDDTAPLPGGVTMPVVSEQIPDKFTIHRPARVQLSPAETRTRMEAFTKEREEAFIAAIREDES